MARAVTVGRMPHVIEHTPIFILCHLFLLVFAFLSHSISPAMPVEPGKRGGEMS